MDKKIVLEFPVKDGGVEITEVTMRRAKVADLRAASKAAAGDMVDYESMLLGNLCGLSPMAMDEVDAADYVQMQKAYEGFLVKKSAGKMPDSSAE